MKDDKKNRSSLIIFTPLCIALSLLFWLLPAWSAERVRQPVQRRPAPARAIRKKAPLRPVAPYVNRFEQNRRNMKVLIRDINNEVNTITASKSLDSLMGEIAGLLEHLKSLQEDLRLTMMEIEEARSLMRQAAETDSRGSISAEEGNRLRGDLQKKLAALEKKRTDLVRKIKYLENKLDTMRDMNQQLRLQLQDAMNKSQQAVQLLSNILKNQHDTLKAIIRNIK